MDTSLDHLGETKKNIKDEIYLKVYLNIWCHKAISKYKSVQKENYETSKFLLTYNYILYNGRVSNRIFASYINYICQLREATLDLDYTKL